MNAPIISTLHILLLIIKSLFACRRFRSLLIMVVYKKYVRSLSLDFDFSCSRCADDSDWLLRLPPARPARKPNPYSRILKCQLQRFASSFSFC